MRMLKQSTAANVMVLMVDSTDHVTGKSGLTLTITVSKDGGVFNSISPTVTDRGDGWYNLALTTSHTDTLGDLAIHITSTGADPSDFYAWIVVRHLADVLFPNVTGRGVDVDASGGIEITPNQNINVNQWMAGTPNALQSGRVDSYGGAMAAGVINAGAIATDAIDGDAIAATAVTEIQSGLATSVALGTHDTDIKARLPASLVSGRIDSSVGAMQNDVVTAASIAAGAITSSEAPALANLDAAITTRAVAGDSMALTGAAVDAVLDEVVEGSMTFRQMLRIFLSALALKSSGGGTATIAFRDQADSKNRISVTVDSSNNRTAIGTLDGS
jgi:hypothetical protein